MKHNLLERNLVLRPSFYTNVSTNSKKSSNFTIFHLVKFCPKIVVKMGNIWKIYEICIFCDFFKDTSGKFTKLEWRAEEVSEHIFFWGILFKGPIFLEWIKKIEKFIKFFPFSPCWNLPKNMVKIKNIWKINKKKSVIT